jgi:hypothetical protein
MMAATSAVSIDQGTMADLGIMASNTKNRIKPGKLPFFQANEI